MAYTPKTYTTDEIKGLIISLMDDGTTRDLDALREVGRKLGLDEDNSTSSTMLPRDILDILEESIRDDARKTTTPIHPHTTFPRTPIAPTMPPGMTISNAEVGR